MFSFFKKLTAGLLVFLFFVTPLAFVRADEPTEGGQEGQEQTEQQPPENPSEQNGSGEESSEGNGQGQGPEGDRGGEGDAQLPPEDPKMPVENNLKKKVAQPDEATGALLYQYDIATPPGRNNLQPNVSLTYNSQERDLFSLLGQGWSLNIPSVQVLNKKGIEKMYTEPAYSSTLSDELVSTISGTFKPKVDNGDFMTYSLANSVWSATDKQGTIYTFGATAASRQDDPANSAKIYKWMLSEIRDKNDNYVRYEYYKDQGQIYPSKILYSGHGANDGIFEIEFVRQARPDQLSASKTGFTVKTNYRISEIQTKINNAWVKKYTINYTTGDNDATSLISSISEQGKDEAGTITSLPATGFEYQAAGTVHWNVDTTTWISPVRIEDGLGGMVGDINGDGLDDLMYSFWQGNGAGEWRKGTYLNNGQGQFVHSVPYDPPFIFLSEANGQYVDYGARLVDVNADGLVDLIAARYNGAPQAYLNTGNGWTASSTWQSPLPFIYQVASGTSTYIANLNGDNLPDVIGTYQNATPLITHAYINTGNGWVEDESWEAPVDVRSTRGTLFADINGDGLDDIVQAARIDGTITLRSFLNNGKGQWTEAAAFAPPTYFFNTNTQTSAVTDLGFRLFDVNGDGLADIVRSGLGAYINTGNGWAQPNDLSWDQPLDFGATTSASSYTSYVTNISGDGMADIFAAKFNNNNNQVETTVVKNLEPRVNLLKKIIYNTGGNTQITYQSTPLYTSGTTLLNPKLSMIIDTVKQVTTSDGNGNTATTNYSYEGGSYYYNNPQDAKFVGFSKVTKTDPAGAITKTYYHQGNDTNSSQGEYEDHVSKIGRPYLIEQSDSSGNLYARTINTWDRSDLGNGRNFVKLIQTIDQAYDGNSSHDDKAVTYTYDNANGNQTEVKQWGRVNGSTNGTFADTGTDAYITDIDYAQNIAANIAGLPARQTTTNQAGIKIAETRNYYDTLPLGQVNIGNLTKAEQWKSGSSYISSTKTYNAYGLVTQERDPRNKLTIYAYDTYNLYPVSITNPLNHVTTIDYDYSLGKPKRSTDANGAITEIAYDGLDRIVTEKQSSDSNPAVLVMKAGYEYGDTPNSVSVKKSSYLDANNAVDSYAYYDGLGRMIQERAETETSNQFSAKDTVYNPNGLVLKESLPYVSSGSAKTAPTATTALYAIYSYDALSRPLTVVNAVGTTTYSYEGWKTTVHDADNKAKDLYRDAYDNLIQVDEHNNRSVYSTVYNWNGLKKLTKITDAMGNIRNFTYDGLGRVLVSEDLHDPNDSTFGEISYEYDANGNVISKTDAKNQTVEYAYDDLNRVMSEDYTDAGGVEVSYAYDTCQNGIGRVCEVITQNLVAQYEYTIQGNVSSEGKTVDQVNYETTYTYDRQGNQLTITNPDGSSTAYEYNNGGQIETVRYKESVDPIYRTLVSDFDYNPAGLVTFEAYPSGSTTNTYDAAKLYRLSQRVTVVTPTGAPAQTVQDLSYTYDPVGNILEIVDASQTSTAKTVVYQYDDLHRLIQATTTPAGLDQPPVIDMYEYDPIGNIIYTSANGAYLYEGNQGSNYANPHAVTSVNGTEYRYDENGNMVAGDNSSSYEWDYNNRLLSVKNNDHNSHYTYDASGQRLTTQVDGGTITVYPSGYYNAGDKVTKHISANGNVIATIEGSGIEATQYDVHTDHLTGSNAVSNSDGEVVEVTDYTPFGEIRTDETTTDFSEQRKYTGHELDRESGLTYANARYYDAKLGRWLSEDNVFKEIVNPQIIEQLTRKQYIQFLSEPQEQNSYSYVRNNPLKYKDYDGNAIFIPFLIYIGIEALSTTLDLFNIYKVDSNLSSTQAERYDARAAALLGTLAPGPGSAYTKSTVKVDQIASRINWGKIWSKGEFKTGFTNLMKHAIDHAEKLGFKNADEYFTGARNFVAEAIEKGYSATIRSTDSTIRIFDQSTRRFASYELTDGKLVPRTFMQADSANYWTNQMKSYGGQILYDLRELIQ